MAPSGTLNYKMQWIHTEEWCDDGCMATHNLCSKGGYSLLYSSAKICSPRNASLSAAAHTVLTFTCTLTDLRMEVVGVV